MVFMVLKKPSFESVCDINHDYVGILTPFLMLICSSLQTHMVGKDDIFAGLNEILQFLKILYIHWSNIDFKLKKKSIDFLYK